MKKVIASIILCTSIFMSGCNKEIKNVDNISTNQQVNMETKNRFYFMQEGNKLLSREIFDKMKDEYFKKYYTNAKDDLLKKTKDEIINIFDTPTYRLSLVESKDSEISKMNKVQDKIVWIYSLDGEDSTSVYIFIKDDKVIDYKLDEYNGLSNADIVNLFEFF